ncbi:SCP2 sterol-binding domain-containing protein [Micromonospora fulviviridis]|uniref:SCP2 sterol-binding domain-containing protein n=1 Tax=Micromonospora fulviviridis TaxID=47860 RepID=A0ABV2VW54_9ACTN
MPDPTATFFDELARRGHERRVVDASGSIRLDLVNQGQLDRWFVTVQSGDIHVSKDEREVDSVIHAERTFFDRVVVGEYSLYAALLSGDVRVEGDLYMFRVLIRVLPSPPHAHHPRTFARDKGQRT